ncbi:MAG: preprotein translocase subunit SecY, partial [Candidatus Ryanbacteria bacterium]|nr:preprotein translocase subunit SecY [Candidatus Ryanbacteria bacterium]
MQSIIGIFKDRDLRRKVIFVLGFLALFRLLAAVPIPSFDPLRRPDIFSNSFLGLLNIFSGGALDNISIVMLGVGPYITASIIMQLFTMIFPRLKEMYQEEGEAGRQRFNQYSRLLTVPLALLQAYGLLVLLNRQQVIPSLSMFEYITNMIVITAGTMFLMWLGELITEKGIGNGISLLIFAGIVSGLPFDIERELFASENIPALLAFAAASLLVIA